MATTPPKGDYEDGATEQASPVAARPPGKFGRPSEADHWSDAEIRTRDLILPLLSDGTRRMLDEDDLLFLRLVRGYWNYDRRTETITDVAESVARWRTALGFDGILRRRLCFDDGTLHRAVWPSWFLGYDVYGHPVILERVAAVDWDRIMDLDADQLLQLRLQALEAIQRVCRARDKPHRVYKAVFIIDVAGATFSMLMNSKIMAFAKQYAKLTEQMYADAAWSNLVVNAPAVARAAWRIIERVVDEETRDIVRFVPTADALLDAGLTMDIVPVDLGGTATSTLLADLIDNGYDAPPSKPHTVPRIVLPAPPPRWHYSWWVLLLALLIPPLLLRRWFVETRRTSN